MNLSHWRGEETCNSVLEQESVVIHEDDDIFVTSIQEICGLSSPIPHLSTSEKTENKQSESKKFAVILKQKR